MSAEDRTRWNERYHNGDAPIAPKANRWLTAQAHLIDAVAALRLQVGETPHSLDIACGAGGSVIWFAQRGWHATGVDVSDQALALAGGATAQMGVAANVRLLHADLDQWRPPADSFDCVTCFHFLNRSLWPSLRTAVRPGGLLAMLTFHRGFLKIRPNATPEYLLEPGELAALIAGWGWTVLTSSDSAADETSERVLAQRPANPHPVSNSTTGRNT
jgi:SAM-dependent methyltransferase